MCYEKSHTIILRPEDYQDGYFDQADQYLYSETLRFERKYSRNDLEE